MRFLADESVERPVVMRLRDAGYDVSYVSEAQPGALDESVLRQANRELRILVTNDKDFGTLAFLQHRASIGVVLLRLPHWKSDRKATRLLSVIRTQRSRLRKAFTVVEEAVARRRPFPARRH
jgi:predicted nuclease of predicted toxin-antitoxin system